MQHQQQWFDHILNSQWVLLRNSKLIQPWRDASGIWTIGHIITNDQKILKACPSSDIHNIQEFSLIHSAWKVERFKKYKPLIYFCAFGKEAIFECTYLAIQSLIEFGKWEHDIVVFTAEKTKQALQEKLSPLGLREKLHFITITPATDNLDWVMARYRIDHPILQQAHPLLYLDTDIICNAPIDQLFINLIDSPMLHACKEGLIGEGSPESGGYWYGWRLMQADNVPYDPLKNGFSAGAIFFKNVKTALSFFNDIINSTYGFMQQQGYRDEFYDQRFANYIFFKFKKIEINIMENWLHLYRIPNGTIRTPNIHERKRGLIHFLNASTENKLVVMQNYIKELRLHKSS